MKVQNTPTNHRREDNVLGTLTIVKLLYTVLLESIRSNSQVGCIE